MEDLEQISKESSNLTPEEKSSKVVNNSFLEKHFQITSRGSNVRTEIIAGITTFLAMVYSVLVVPNLLGAAGFDKESVFTATCLLTALGSLAIGYFANVPMGIGCAISLTAFTAFSLVLGQHVSVEQALGAIFAMGVLFTIISASGIRRWILRNLPASIAHGVGIGIGLFLLLIAASGINFIVPNHSSQIPVKLGDFTSFPVLMAFFGLIAIIALERLQVKGSILIVIIVLTIIGIVLDPNVKYHGFFEAPSFGKHSLFLQADFKAILDPNIIPAVLALVMTAVFDATGTIRAVAGVAGLVTKEGQIVNGRSALVCDSASSIFAGLAGTAPAAVYIESCTGTVAGGKTGLTAIVIGIGFAIMLFLRPVAFLVPDYATAPALMYVGLLMLSNVTQLDFKDKVGAMSGLVTAIFIVLTANIVTGIMLGFCCLVVARVITGEFKKLNVGTVVIAIALFVFYVGKWAL